MSNKMIIDASHPEETRVVVLRGNRVEEFDFESANKKPLRGNIYLAKVTRVEPSLQAAFVDYGGNRHGFLAFSEIHPDYYQIPVADRQALLEEEARSHRDDDEEPRGGERRSRRHRRPRPQEAEMRSQGDERVSEPADQAEAEQKQLDFDANEPRTDGEAFAPARILVEDKYVRAAVGGLGGVKAGANYIASLRAAEDAKARGFDQVLWTDAHEHRYLEEVGTMNMVARIGDEIVTPPLGGSILAGVTRDSVITLLREWGFTVNERPLGMEELLRAHRGGTLREIFGCGTAAVITPVGTLGWKGEEVVVNGGQPGEIARRLLEAITAIQYARQPDTHGWMTELDPS